MKAKARRKSINRSSILAKVEDWLDNKVGVKILRIANANNGKCFVDNRREQLRILFPDIAASLQDNSLVFGLVLDQQSGWNLCHFRYSRDRPSSSMVAKICFEIGFETSAPILSRIYSSAKDSGNLEAVKNLAGPLVVMINSTKGLDNAV